MKMFLLRTKETSCPAGQCRKGCGCDQCAFVIIRAEDENAARQIALTSNTHGKFLTGIDWSDPATTSCNEFPLLDGPRGIVVGSWLAQYQPG